MDDIVKRLRDRAGKYDEYSWHEEIELEAANEIERLRADLNEAMKKLLDNIDYVHNNKQWLMI